MFVTTSPLATRGSRISRNCRQLVCVKDERYGRDACTYVHFLRSSVLFTIYIYKVKTWPREEKKRKETCNNLMVEELQLEIPTEI